MLLSLVLGVFHLLRLLILYEQWAGERLCLESAIPRHRRVGRPISVSAVPFGPGIDIWRSCRFFGVPSFVHYVCCLVALVGFSLGVLGLIMVVFDTLVGRSAVMVLRPGHVRLLLFGFWMSFSFFSGIQLPLVLICLQGPFLLGITLRVLLVGSPLGGLPENGSVAGFLASGELVRGGPSALSAALGGAGVCLARGSGGSVKRVRLNRKTPTHLARQGISEVQVRPRVWKRLRDPLGSDSGLSGAKFLRVHQEAEGHDPGFARVGIG